MRARVGPTTVRLSFSVRRRVWVTRRTSSSVTASTRRTTSSIIRTWPVTISCAPNHPATLRVSLGAEEEAAFDQLFGLCELRLGDAFFELLKLVHYAGEGLGGARGVNTRGYAEGAAVQVMVVIAVHVVGQPPVLPQLNEEPTAHAISEDDVQKVERVAVRVVDGQAPDSEAQVDLLDLPILDVHPREVLIVGGGGKGAGLGGLPTVQAGGKCFDNLVMVHGPCYGDHRVVRRVVGVEIVEELVPGDGIYRVSGPADVPSQGVIGPDNLVEQYLSPLVGGVLDHVQLFEDDASFLFDVLGVEAGSCGACRLGGQGPRGSGGGATLAQ